MAPESDTGSDALWIGFAVGGPNPCRGPALSLILVRTAYFLRETTFLEQEVSSKMMNPGEDLSDKVTVLTREEHDVSRFPAEGPKKGTGAAGLAVMRRDDVYGVQETAVV